MPFYNRIPQPLRWRWVDDDIDERQAWDADAFRAPGVFIYTILMINYTNTKMNRVREVSPLEPQECLVFLKNCWNYVFEYSLVAYLSYSRLQMALIEARSKHSFKKKRGIHFITWNWADIILEYIDWPTFL